MSHSLTSSIVGLLAAGALVGVAPPSTPVGNAASLRAGIAAVSVQPQARIVHVSVTDKNDKAVTDLQAADFQVKADGKSQEVVAVRPATMPLRIAVLVADGGTGLFQWGLSHFVDKLLGHAEFALTSVILQPQKVIDYSSDAGALSMALRRLGKRGQQSGAQLMEAIQDAAKEVGHETRRPVIVVTRVGGEDASLIPAKDVRDQLRKSGAILYVLSTVGAQRAAPSQARGTDAVSVQQGQLRDSELADGAFALAQVLGDGSKESGGRHDEIVSTTLVTALERVAEELLHQYEITYTGLGRRSGDRLSVTATRKGLTVHAPTRVR